MPTASVGAPPARDSSVFSPTSWAIWVSMSGVTVKPQPETTCAACSGGGADQPGRAVHGEIDAGLRAR